MLITYRHNVLVWLQYECCGVDGYEDFDEAENWNRNRSFTIEGRTFSQEMLTPVACCAYDGDFPEIEIRSVNCTFTLEEEFNNFNKVGIISFLMKLKLLHC